ncbi:MAG TPA: preprotein translocase subunit YajC [Gammaproteobacteria bacterium]|nr:preprotein translocase subunit YajC [Gammaproteobacteria bacterium]
MSFFITDAYAAAGGAQDGSGLGFILTLAGMIAIFYFLMIRPQQKRQKEHTALLSALSKGDELVTSGGMLGRVTEVGDQFVSLEIAKGVEVKIQKQSVGAVLPKGTLKNI